MLRHLVPAVMVAILFFSLTFLACDDDDDSSGSSGHANDDDASPADDDNDDNNDDNNDNDSGDDDDNDDNDDDDNNDNNDDTYDFTGEPLAVLNCEARFAEVGQSLHFSGVESSDPDGGSLTYLIEFGDGDLVVDPEADHAFDAPGVYRVSLTVTDQDAFTDLSTCIVSVGDFPQGSGELDVIDFKPNWYDPTITEPGDEPEHGGHFWAFYVSPLDAEPDNLLINGELYDPEDPPAGVAWCEMVPPLLTPGDIGIVRCQADGAAFDAGQTVTVEVRDGDTSLWEREQTLPAPTLMPSYYTASVDGAELLLHVRNDSDRVFTVTGLSLNGLDVTDFISVEHPVPAPTETAIIRVPLENGPTYYKWLVFTVHGSDGKGEVAVSRPLRLFPPAFHIGNWNDSSGDVFTDPEERLTLQTAAGIDTLLWSPSETVTPELVFGIAEEFGVNIWTHWGGLDQWQLDIIAEWGENPHWIGNAVKGEGDGEDPNIPLEKLFTHREVWPHQRLWIYNNMANRFSTWGGMADFSGMDHYCVWAAQANTNWPPFYWDHIEMLGRYAEVMRRNAEPAPIWHWTQSSWNDFDINGNQVRCTTADEIRAQWYQVLAYGAKSIWWFYYRYDFTEDCDDPLAEQQHADLAAELRACEDVVLEGDAALRGLAWATSPNEKVDLNTITSPYGMLIILNNFDYTLNLIGPWVWHEQTDVVVNLTPPAGFEPDIFWLVQGDMQIPLESRKVNENKWRFTLPSLKVAEAILVTPEQ